MEENYINQFVLSFHLVTLCYVRFRVRLNSTILDKKVMIMMIIIMRATPLFVLNSLYVGIHLFSGDDHKLCLKDFSSELIRKLEGRLKNDQTAFEQVCLSFGIDRIPFFSREDTRERGASHVLLLLHAAHPKRSPRFQLAFVSAR